MSVKDEAEKLMKMAIESGAESDEVDAVPWLIAKYKESTDREVTLLKFLSKTLANFEYRIKVLEKKLGKG